MNLKNTCFYLFAFFVISLMVSCTIEKRLHLPGYHVEKPGYLTKRVKVNDEHDNQKAEDADHIKPEKSLLLPDAAKIKDIRTNHIAGDNLRAFAQLNDAFSLTGKNTIPSGYQALDPDNGILSLLKPLQPRSFRKTLPERAYNLKDTRSTADNTLPDEPEHASMHWGAIAGFVTGIVSLFIFGIILGVCAIVFSSLALSRIRSEPAKFTGRGLAIAGLILGIIGVVGAVIVSMYLL